MSKSTKKIIIIAGFLLSLVLFSFELFLLWILVTLVLLTIPTPNDVKSGILNSPEPTENRTSLEAAYRKLEAQIVEETNPDVARGMQRALDEVRQLSPQSSYVEPCETSSQQHATQQPHKSATSIDLKTAMGLDGADSTISLLYIGAFLLLGGIGLFVVYGDFSGFVRLTTMLLAAIAFYGSGIMLWKGSSRLRPAAMTFLAIGLALIPLSGGATVYLLDTPTSASWFVTSLIGLALYGYALYVVRSQVMEYLSFILWLSLSVSVLNLTDMSVIGLVWGVLFISSASLVLVRWLVESAIIDLTASSQTVSTFLVPLAVAYGYLYNGIYSTSQLGVSLMLAALYYLICLIAVEMTEVRRAYYILLTHGTALFGLMCFLYVYLSDTDSFALSLMGLGIIHAIIWLFGRRVLSVVPLYDQFVYYLGAGLAVVAWTLVVEDPELSLIGLSAVVVISVMLSIARYKVVPFGLAIISGLILPFALAAVVPGDGSEVYLQYVSIYLLVVGLLLGSVRYAWRSFSERVVLLQLSYGFCLLAAWVAGLSTEHFLWQIVMSIAVLGSVIIVAMYDKYPQVLYAVLPIGFTITTIVLDKIFPAMVWHEIIVYGASIVSIVLYLVSLMINRDWYRLPLVVSTVAGGIIAWSVVFTSMTEGQYTLTYTAPVLLAVVSLVVLFEKRLFKGGVLFVLLPGFGFILALMQTIGLTWNEVNILVYSHILAVYGLASSYLIAKYSTSKELISLSKYTTLAIFTLPVAIQALANGGTYSLVLLFEQLALLIFGVATNRSYAVYWGAVVSVLSVIYLLRSFFYLQLLIAAVVLIGYAVYRLSRK